MLMTVVLTKPKAFNLPDGLIDSMIVVLTLLGLILEKHSEMSGDKELIHRRDSLVNEVFNLKASTNFWFRFLYVILLISSFLLLIYLCTGIIDSWKLGVLFLFLLIPFALIYITSEVYYYVYKDKNISPYLIYYLYLLLIYIVSLVHKF